MVPKSGYWRANKYTDFFVKCELTEICKDGRDPFSYTGNCEKGYKGNLCSSCEEGYSKTFDKRCLECPS